MNTLYHSASGWIADEYSVSNTISYNGNADPSSLVQIAGNRHTTADLLTILASHDDPRIKSAIADNPCTPDAVLLQFAVDKSVDIRYQLAENHNIPLLVLFILAKDENPYVEARAIKTINRLSTNSKTQSL